MLSTARTALVAALAFLPSSGRLKLAPEPDQSVTKSFSLTAELALEDLLLELGDREIDPSALGFPTAELTIEYVVTVTDTYGELVDGHATIERTFDEISAEARFEGSIVEDGGESSEGSSPLEGATVVFTWNPDAEAYEASSETVDDELLEGLRADMDFAFLLPEGGADLEDAWEVAGFGIDLLQPGGDLALEFDGSEESDGFDEEDAEALEEAAAELLETELEAEFREVTEEDDLELGNVALAMEIDTSLDLTEWLESMLARGEIQVGDSEPELDRAEVSLEASPRGSLLWNLEDDLFHQFELQAACILTFEADASAESAGFDVSFSAEFSGDLRIAAEARP